MAISGSIACLDYACSGSITFAVHRKVVCVQVVVATPGRLWELMQEGHTHLTDMSNLAFFVLDEADRMVQTGHFQVLPWLMLLHHKLDKHHTLTISAVIWLSLEAQSLALWCYCNCDYHVVTRL